MRNSEGKEYLGEAGSTVRSLATGSGTLGPRPERPSHLCRSVFLESPSSPSPVRTPSLRDVSVEREILREKREGLLCRIVTSAEPADSVLRPEGVENAVLGADDDPSIGERG